MAKNSLLLKPLLAAVVVAVLIAMVGFLVRTRLVLNLRDELSNEQMAVVRQQASGLRLEMRDLSSDVEFLSQMTSSLMTVKPDGHVAFSPQLTRQLLDFARARGRYEKVSIINSEGIEIVNVQSTSWDGTGKLNFQASQQEEPLSPSLRPVLDDLVNTPSGGIYFSPLSLKMQGGVVETPYTPILRAGQVLLGPDKKPVAYLLLNYFGRRLLESLRREDVRMGMSTMLLNHDGYWLFGGEGGSEWAFLFSGRKNQTMAVEDPKIWKFLTQSQRGSRILPDGLVTYDTVRPLPGLDATDSASWFWKVATWVKPAEISERENRAVAYVWLITILSIMVVSPVAYIIVQAGEKDRATTLASRQAHALLESVMNSSVDGVVACRAIRRGNGQIAEDFRILLSNPAAERMAARDKYGLRGANLRAEFPDFSNDSLIQNYLHVVESGMRFEAEHPVPSEKKWFRLVVVKLDDGIVMSFSDITDRKRAIEEMRIAKETAESASRAKSQFLAMMSHEVRTPMNGVLGFAALLGKTRLDTEQQDYVETLTSSGEFLLRVLDDILDYSRIESGKLELVMSPFNPAETMRQVHELFTQSAETKGVSLRVEMEKNVPAEVCGDEGRVRQVLVNLIGNALKFTEQGEVVMQMNEGDDGGRKILQFAVKDTGQGIPVGMQDRLFKAFSQVDSTPTRRHGGTGLGLSICKRLVEMMGGRIEVQSEAGRGAKFTFFIPLLPPGRTAKDLPAKPTESVGDFLVGKNLRVLVVEDDATNRKLIQRMLEKLGTNVAMVSSGAEAVKLSEGGECFDLVLMDMQMPDMDGPETTRKLREIEKNSPQNSRMIISALTANVTDRDRVECREAGMDEFLSKPVRLSELEKLIIKVAGKNNPQSLQTPKINLL